jgi:hypothetical protein
MHAIHQSMSISTLSRDQVVPLQKRLVNDFSNRVHIKMSCQVCLQMFKIDHLWCGRCLAPLTIANQMIDELFYTEKIDGSTMYERCREFASAVVERNLFNKTEYEHMIQEIARDMTRQYIEI